MDLAKHTILNNSFRDAKMPGGPQVSKTSRYVITAAASPVEKRSKNKPDTSCKYCCDMRGLRNERFAKSEVFLSKVWSLWQHENEHEEENRKDVEKDAFRIATFRFFCF